MLLSRISLTLQRSQDSEESNNTVSDQIDNNTCPENCACRFKESLLDVDEEDIPITRDNFFPISEIPDEVWDFLKEFEKDINEYSCSDSDEYYSTL